MNVVPPYRASGAKRSADYDDNDDDDALDAELDTVSEEERQAHIQRVMTRVKEDIAIDRKNAQAAAVRRMTTMRRREDDPSLDEEIEEVRACESRSN